MKYKTLWNARDGSKVIAWESPLEEGVFHFPANSVEIEPPEFDPVSKVCSWNGLKWIVSDLPKKEYDAIIIGGGGHGLTTAYYLAKNEDNNYTTKDTII